MQLGAERSAVISRLLAAVQERGAFTFIRPQGGVGPVGGGGVVGGWDECNRCHPSTFKRALIYDLYCSSGVREVCTFHFLPCLKVNCIIPFPSCARAGEKMNRGNCFKCMTLIATLIKRTVFDIWTVSHSYGKQKVGKAWQIRNKSLLYTIKALPDCPYLGTCGILKKYKITISFNSIPCNLFLRQSYI